MDTPTKVMSLVERRPTEKMPLTPLETLEAFVADVRSGKIKPEGVAIHWYEQLENGRRRPEVWHANMTYEQIIALLEVHKKTVLASWSEED